MIYHHYNKLHATTTDSYHTTIMHVMMCYDCYEIITHHNMHYCCVVADTCCSMELVVMGMEHSFNCPAHTQCPGLYGFCCVGAGPGPVPTQQLQLVVHKLLLGTESHPVCSMVYSLKLCSMHGPVLTVCPVVPCTVCPCPNRLPM